MYCVKLSSYFVCTLNFSSFVLNISFGSQPFWNDKHLHAVVFNTHTFILYVTDVNFHRSLQTGQYWSAWVLLTEDSLSKPPSSSPSPPSQGWRTFISASVWLLLHLLLIAESVKVSVDKTYVHSIINDNFFFLLYYVTSSYT